MHNLIHDCYDLPASKRKKKKKKKYFLQPRQKDFINDMWSEKKLNPSKVQIEKQRLRFELNGGYL